MSGGLYSLTSTLMTDFFRETFFITTFIFYVEFLPDIYWEEIAKKNIFSYFVSLEMSDLGF